MTGCQDYHGGEIFGDRIWNVGDEKVMGLGRDEGWQSGEEGAVKGWREGSKRNCDLSWKLLELKSQYTAT